VVSFITQIDVAETAWELESNIVPLPMELTFFGSICRLPGLPGWRKG